MSVIDFQLEGGQDPNDPTPTLGTLTNPYDSGGLLGPNANSGGDPNVCRRNGGARFHSPIAGEYHPHADIAKHARVHNGDCHADTGVLDGGGLRDANPGADDRHIYTSDHACDSRRPSTNGYPGVQPIPVETLDR